MKTKSPIFSHLLVSFIFCFVQIGVSASVQPYNYIGTSLSAVAVLYSSSSTLPQSTTSTFTTAYASTVSSSYKFMYSLCSYQETGDMDDSLLKIDQTATSTTQFTLQVLCTGSSLVNRIWVSYMVVEDANSMILPIRVEYNNLGNISTGTGTRQQIVNTDFSTLTTESFSTNLTQNKAYVWIIGFEMQALTGSFHLKTNVSVIASTTFSTTFSTTLDCLVDYVYLMHVFINTKKMTTQTLFIYNNSYIFSTTTTSISIPEHFNSYGHLMLGLAAWKGQGTTGGVSIGFSYTNLTTSLSATLTTPVTQINLNYLFMALIQCNSAYPYYKSSAKTACVAQCQSNETQSPSTSICASCTSPCTACYNSTTNCTACASGYSLNGNTCGSVSEEKSTQLYLLAFLGIIPVAILIVFFCLRRKKYVLNLQELSQQPSINFL